MVRKSFGCCQGMDQRRLRGSVDHEQDSREVRVLQEEAEGVGSAWQIIDPEADVVSSKLHVCWGGREFHEQAKKVLTSLMLGASPGRLSALKPGRAEFVIGTSKQTVKVILESSYERTEDAGT